jgi:hypothetical protein
MILRTSAGSPTLSPILGYIGVDNRRLFIIYRAHKLPDI